MFRASNSRRIPAFVVRLLLLIGLVTGLFIAGASTAGAQDSVDDWVAVTGVQKLPGPGLYTDYSGAVLNPDGTLLAVDNGEDDIIEYTPNGNGGWNLGRIIDLEQSELSDPVDDLEDITRMGNNRYAIIDENDNTLTVFDLLPGQDTVDEIYTVALWPFVDNFGGNGIEGLFYSFEDSVGDTDTFYVASEVNALIVKLDIVDGEVTNRGPDIKLNIPAASAIYRVPNDGTFYIVANRTRSVYRFAPDGVLLGPPRRLNFNNPEGLTFSDDGSRILVVGESFGGNEIQEFRPPTQRGQTLLTQFTQGNSDGTQNGNGTVNLNGDRLFIGPGPFNESALHISSLCIPDDAQIRRAHLSFVPAASEGSTASLRIVGHRTAVSPALASSQNNFTNRGPTATVIDQATAPSWDGGREWRQFAPDLTELIDEIRSLPGRAECGPVTLRLSTNGARRTARSAEAGARLAPNLVIDWVSVATPPALTVNADASCAADGTGRIDVTVSNPTNVATTVTVGLTTKSNQSIFISAQSERDVYWSGLADGRYLVSTLVSEVPAGNSDVVVDCGRQVSFSQRCIRPGNGAVDITVLNVGDQPAELRTSVGDVSAQPLYLHGWQSGGQSAANILDGEYSLTVLRGNAVEFAETITVDCGPPPPACSYTLFNNASFRILAYISIGGVQSELGRVDAGASAEIAMPPGFDPSFGDTFFLYDESFRFLQWDSVDAAGVAVQCGWRLYYPFANPLPPAEPLPPVGVTLACTGRIGEVRLAIVNQTDSFAQLNVSFLDATRVTALTAGASVGIVFGDVPSGLQPLVITNADAVVFDESLPVDCGLAPAEPEPDRERAPDVVHATSCLGGNGRHDVTWVNTGIADASYTLDFEGLSQRRVVVTAGDWGRLPFTGRADGTYQVTVRRNGLVVSERSVVVDCDAPDPQLDDPEVQAISSCRNGFGYILFQMVNDTLSPAPYVIEFEGVPNRSTTAAAHGAAVRAVTGRATGSYEAVVRKSGAIVASLTIDVDCG